MRHRSLVIMVVIVAALAVAPRASEQYDELKSSAIESVERGIWGTFLSLHAPGALNDDVRPAADAGGANHVARTNSSALWSETAPVAGESTSAARRGKSPQAQIERHAGHEFHAEEALAGLVASFATGVETGDFTFTVEPESPPEAVEKALPALVLRRDLGAVGEKVTALRLEQIAGRERAAEARAGEEATREAVRFLARFHEHNMLRVVRKQVPPPGAPTLETEESEGFKLHIPAPPAAPKKQIKDKPNQKLTCADDPAPVASPYSALDALRTAFVGEF